jgi:hypothetical protein
MFHQRTRFRFKKRLHGELLQRVVGDVQHDFHGSLFLRGIPGTGAGFVVG